MGNQTTSATVGYEAELLCMADALCDQQAEAANLDAISAATDQISRS